MQVHKAVSLAFLSSRSSGYRNKAMKNKILSHLRSVSVPHFLIFTVLLLLALTIHVPGQQVARNFAPNSDRPVTTASVSIVSASVSIASMERRVFDLVNQERVQHGLRPVVWVDKIAAVARYYSNDMATNDFFSHTDRQGRRAGKRADELGVNDWKQISENIAWLTGSDPAGRVVTCWMNSPGHRRNILDPGSKESGIGLAIAADGKYYFTQVFMIRK